MDKLDTIRQILSTFSAEEKGRIFELLRLVLELTPLLTFELF